MRLQKRYTVLKETDIAEHLSGAMQNLLNSICAAVEDGRKDAGKQTLACLVIEKDWPEYQPTVDLLSAKINED